MNKKNIFLLILITILIISCMNEKNSMDIGTKITNPKMKNTYSNQMAYINAGSAERTFLTTDKDIDYYFALNKKDEVIYIKTFSPNFKTSEGLNINSSISDCLQFSEKGIRVEKGICYYIPLKSGWNVDIGDINKNIATIKTEGGIRHFFKSKETLSYNVSLDEWRDIISNPEIHKINDTNQMIFAPVDSQ